MFACLYFPYDKKNLRKQSGSESILIFNGISCNVLKSHDFLIVKKAGLFDKKGNKIIFWFEFTHLVGWSALKPDNITLCSSSVRISRPHSGKSRLYKKNCILMRSLLLKGIQCLKNFFRNEASKWRRKKPAEYLSFKLWTHWSSILFDWGASVGAVCTKVTVWCRRVGNVNIN